jgi:CRISPR-associated protein Cas2
MPCLLVYDIPDDRVRTKIADLCLDYGMDRIQYSAFAGQLSKVHQRELMARIKRQIGRKAAKVQLVYVNDGDWSQRVVVEQEERASSE